MAFNGFAEYMRMKQDKLMSQQEEQYQNGAQSKVLHGLTFYSTGNVADGDALKRLVIDNGGVWSNYDTSKVTHVVADVLSLSRYKKLFPQHFKASYRPQQTQQVVVKPQWIKRCVEQGQLLKVETDDVPQWSSSTGDPPVQQSDWVHKNSSMNASFVQNFYQNSRLHHLSKWKQLVSQYSYNKIIESDSLRTIVHIDLDCFFASVSVLSRNGGLDDKPVAVSHHQQSQDGSQQNGGSDVASCNYKAREFGVKNGMSIRSAMQLCPQLNVVPYDFDLYKEAMLKFYEVLKTFSWNGVGFDALLGCSCDEAFIDLTSIAESCQETASTFYQRISHDQKSQCSGIQIVCHELQELIYSSIKVHASVGIGPSMLLARMATRQAKPSGLYHVDGDEHKIQDFMSQIMVANLPQVGRGIVEKLADALRIQRDGLSIQQLKNALIVEVSSSRSLSIKCRLYLQKILGEKTGQKLFAQIHGFEEVEESSMFSKSLRTGLLGTISAVQVAEEYINDASPISKTVGAEINWGVRFENYEQLHVFMEQLFLQVCYSLYSLDDARQYGLGFEEQLNLLPNNKLVGQVILKLRLRHPDGPHEPTYKSLGCGHFVPFSQSAKVVSTSTLITMYNIITNKLMDDLRQQWWTTQGKAIAKAEDYKKTTELETLRMIFLRDLRGVGISFAQISDKSQPQQVSAAKKRSLVKASTFVVPQLTPRKRKRANSISASQIDWEVMEQLPPEIVDEYLQHFSPPKKRTDNQRPSKTPAITPSQVDSEVWNALPSSLRANLRSEYSLEDIPQFDDSNNVENFDLDATMAVWTLMLQEQDVQTLQESIKQCLKDCYALHNMEYAQRIQRWVGSTQQLDPDFKLGIADDVGSKLLKYKF